MCGLIGGIGRTPPTREKIQKALNALNHRGPDGHGQWTSADGRFFLGHTRLSIIGLHNGDQPMVNAEGDVRLAVNGEFYGYKAIRDDLRR
jgi:asparagine synthase (glutamine-hydrolysing)